MTSSGVCEGQVGHALEAKIWREKIADALKQNIWQISWKDDKYSQNSWFF